VDRYVVQGFLIVQVDLWNHSAELAQALVQSGDDLIGHGHSNVLLDSEQLLHPSRCR